VRHFVQDDFVELSFGEQVVEIGNIEFHLAG
jgi:hypothetical protein